MPEVLPPFHYNHQTVGEPEMLKRFTKQDGDFKVIRIPYLLHWAKGPHGGHCRIFSPRQGRGLIVWQFNNSDYYGYSNKRAWIVPGIVAIRHNDDKGGTLKHVEPVGWSVQWPRIYVKRRYCGFEAGVVGPGAL